MLLTAMTIAANAVRVQPGVTAVTQSDGTTVNIRGFGNDKFCYYTTTDGTLLVHEGFSYYVANVESDGTLTSTGLLAHDKGQRTVEETVAIERQNRNLFFNPPTATANARRNIYTEAPVTPSGRSLFPHTGSPKVLVLLVEFADSVFHVSNPKATFDKYLNHTGYFNKTDDPEMYAGSSMHNYGSVRQYFNDMSFGQFTPQFDVYGPYKLSGSLKYYGEGNGDHMTRLIPDACAAADGDVDFSEYDQDGDGMVDLVYIIYAGYSQSVTGNSTDCIWPKAGWTNISTKYDGKGVSHYGVNNELNGTPQKGYIINGIGLFCHEFSHCLGLPDLYTTDYEIPYRCVNQSPEYYDLMDGGEYTYNGYCPTAYTAWERESMGWMSIDTLKAPADLTLLPLDSDGGKAYRIMNDADSTGHEYYILENIQKKGWNAHLYGHGMMVTHVDYSASAFSLSSNTVNSVAGHPRLTFLAADGIGVPYSLYNQIVTEDTDETVKGINADFVAKYGGQEFTAAMYIDEAAGDLFPGTSNVTELTDTSSPMNSWVYTGLSMGKPITDIAEDASTGMVSFKFMGGTATSIDAVTTEITGVNAQQEIFSLDGRLMSTDLQSLPKGIYVVGGHKVLR